MKHVFQGNPWVVHSSITPIDSQVFKEIKAIREGNNPDKPAMNMVNDAENIDHDNDEYSENVRWKYYLKAILTKSSWYLMNQE